jgi:hypothetical protein
MNNPIQLMQMMKNPQAMLQQMMNNSQFANNPMAQNIFNMAKNGNVKEIEQLGRNIAKERGINFDEEFQKFKKQHGMK